MGVHLDLLPSQSENQVPSFFSSQGRLVLLSVKNALSFLVELLSGGSSLLVCPRRTLGVLLEKRRVGKGHSSGSRS